MDKANDVKEIQSEEGPESGSEHRNETQQSEPDVPPLSNQKPESEGEEEKDTTTAVLKQNISSERSHTAPAEEDITDQGPNDTKDKTEVDSEENSAKKVVSGSISLSTLISTIIKGTVASMDDVGRDIRSSAASHEATSSGETVSSSELQDEGLSSEAENASNETEPVQGDALKENGEELVEATPPPLAFNSAASCYERGRGRRGRAQNRFALSWNMRCQETNGMPQTETIDTEAGKIYQCVSCKVSFNYEQDMRMHLQTHLRPRYFCPVCSRRFLNQSTLERHMVTHDQTKPYRCSICSQGFRIKSNLNRHYQRIHNSKVEIEDARRGRPTGSISRPSLPPQEDNLTNPNLPISNFGKVAGSVPHTYPSPTPSLYTDRQVPVSNFAPPQMDFRPNTHFEQTANPPEPDNNVVSSTERVADFAQTQRTFEFDRSTFLNTEPVDKQGPEDNEPNDSLSQGRMPARSLVEDDDDDDSYAHLFLSRYPDVESAVDAIRRIETERLFHQELLLEELKLRRKYGLPSSSVIEDLKKELSLKEKIGDLDSFIAQGGGDTERPKGLTLTKPVGDLSHITETSHGISPNQQLFDPSFQMEPSARGDYPVGMVPGRLENKRIAPSSIPSDLLHHGTPDIMLESQASAQLRRLSAANAATYATNPLAGNTGSLSSFGSTNNGRYGLPPIPAELNTNDWGASQHLKALTPPYGRPRRGRRRLASMPASLPSLPPKYPRESEMQQRFSLPPRSLESPAPISQVVHHRPVLSHGPPQALPPPPLMRPPPLPFRMQHDSSHRFSSVPNLPPPPDTVPQLSPRYSSPSRFRHPGLQQPTTTKFRLLMEEANRPEGNSSGAVQSVLQPHPAKSIQSSGVSDHAPDMINPFSISGPPNRSVKPVNGNGLQTPNTSSAFSSPTKDTPPASKHINEEHEDAPAIPLDLSKKS